MLQTQDRVGCWYREFYQGYQNCLTGLTDQVSGLIWLQNRSTNKPVENRRFSGSKRANRIRLIQLLFYFNENIFFPYQQRSITENTSLSLRRNHHMNHLLPLPATWSRHDTTASSPLLNLCVAIFEFLSV